MTDFLSFLSNLAKVYDPLIPFLKECLDAQGDDTIYDLGAGSGGQWPRIIEKLNEGDTEVKVVLTNLFPINNPPIHPQIKTESKSVDYRTQASELDGLKTMFLSFHHNNRKDAKDLLLNFQKNKDHILIVEGQERKWKYIFPMLLSPINLLLFTPFIRPFRIDRIIFTYLIPILPLAVLWDGIVSVLRTYKLYDFGEMMFEHTDENYYWEMSTIGEGPFKLLYIYGRPEKEPLD